MFFEVFSVCFLVSCGYSFFIFQKIQNLETKLFNLTQKVNFYLLELKTRQAIETFKKDFPNNKFLPDSFFVLEKTRLKEVLEKTIQDKALRSDTNLTFLDRLKELQRMLSEN